VGIATAAAAAAAFRQQEAEPLPLAAPHVHEAKLEAIDHPLLVLQGRYRSELGASTSSSLGWRNC